MHHELAAMQQAIERNVIDVDKLQRLAYLAREIEPVYCLCKRGVIAIYYAPNHNNSLSLLSGVPHPAYRMEPE
jgi:hypothetical protein